MRDGDELTLDVTLGRRETAQNGASESPAAAEPSESDVLGMTVTVLTPEMAAELGAPRDATGLAITGIDPEGAAAEKGLAAGDVISPTSTSNPSPAWPT